MNQILRWGGGLLTACGGFLAAGLLAGCTDLSAPTGEALVTTTYTYGDGAGAGGRVTRTVGVDGSESLHGETALAEGGERVRIVEDAILDRAGHLVRAEVVVARGCDAPPDEHAVLEPARGVVLVSGPGGQVEWTVPADAPWAYAPLARAGGLAVLTPVGAFIAMRAAAGAGAVRVVQVGSRSSYTTPADQIAVPTESGVTVALETASATADGGFIRSVDLPELGIAMARVDEPPGKPQPVCVREGADATVAGSRSPI